MEGKSTDITSEMEPRVRFSSVLKGSLEHFLEDHPSCVNQFEELCQAMKRHLHEMEDCGVTPVLPDGKVGGNAGAILATCEGNFLIVSKSGKKAHMNMDTHHDFVVVKEFHKDTWSCDYYANDNEVLPTSDTPLYFTALTMLTEKNSLNWTVYPKYLLHGHAFSTEEDAKRLGFPISTHVTLCSTPSDSEALHDLLEEYAYPEHKVFIRKAHGFVLLGDSPDDSWQTFCERIKPHLLPCSGK